MTTATAPDTATVTIPPEYLDDFREAVVFEIACDTHAVEINRKAIQRADQRREDAWKGTCEEDWRSSVRLLAQVGVLLDQLEAAEPGHEFTASADEATLAHACHAMAEKVVEPRVSGLLRYSPLSGSVATDLHEQLDRLAWAIDNSARLS